MPGICSTAAGACDRNARVQAPHAELPTRSSSLSIIGVLGCQAKAFASVDA